MKWEIRELNDKNSAILVPKSEIIHSLWFRFEVLAIMVARADKLFGALVIMCHAYLFCNMCGNVYLLFQRLFGFTMVDPLNVFFYLLFPSFRFLFTLAFMSKVSQSAFKLLSAST